MKIGKRESNRVIIVNENVLNVVPLNIGDKVRNKKKSICRY
jgi:hypothetical protein